MDLFLFDLWWMSYNISLALLAVVFGNLMLQVKNRFVKIVLGILWLLFIPNTLYMLTDIYHLWDDWYKTTLFFNIVLIPLYLLIMLVGMITFIKALRPFEKILKENSKTEKHASLILFVMNFVIAFGVMLGRFQRTNSWEVFTNFPKVIHDVLGIFTSFDLLLYIVLFGILGNLLFFLYSKKKLNFLNI